MKWHEVYIEERRRALAGVESFFLDLPPGLFEQARLLRTDLLASASEGSDLSAVFAEEYGHPALLYPCWVLDAWRGDSGAADESLTDDIIRGAFFSTAAWFLLEQIDDPSNTRSSNASLLAPALRDEAARYFGVQIEPGAAFCDFYRSTWQTYTADQLQDTELRLEHRGPDHSAARYAPLKIGALAAAQLSGHPEALMELDHRLDELHAVFGLVQDLRGLKRDIQSGRISALVLQTMRAAGLAPADAGDRERLLGAVLLSGEIRDSIERNRENLERFRAWSGAQSLTGFHPFLDFQDAALDQAEGLFSLGGKKVRSKGPIPPGEFIHATPDAEKLASEMAAAFLFSDPALKESWEVHRYGLFGRPETVSRFPAGLVLEFLAMSGRELSPQIDAHLLQMAENGFGYFDDPDTPLRDADTVGLALRDADTLGLALRLLAYRPDTGGKIQARLDPLLDDLPGAVLADGRIPVWLDAGKGPNHTPAGVRLVGEDCGVVEAHLLLGLLAFDPERFKDIIAASAAGIFERFLRNGAGISVNYPTLYALDALRRLISTLESGGFGIRDKDAISAKYQDVLQTELRLRRLTAQDAALALAASRFPLAADLSSPAWRPLIRKAQRPDGGWTAEPFCFVANRGNTAGWYRSRTMTTVLCLRGLVLGVDPAVQFGG